MRPPREESSSSNESEKTSPNSNKIDKSPNLRRSSRLQQVNNRTDLSSVSSRRAALRSFKSGEQTSKESPADARPYNTRASLNDSKNKLRTLKVKQENKISSPRSVGTRAENKIQSSVKTKSPPKLPLKRQKIQNKNIPKKKEAFDKEQLFFSPNRTLSGAVKMSASISSNKAVKELQPSTSELQNSSNQIATVLKEPGPPFAKIRKLNNQTLSGENGILPVERPTAEICLVIIIHLVNFVVNLLIESLLLGTQRSSFSRDTPPNLSEPSSSELQTSVDQCEGPHIRSLPPFRSSFSEASPTRTIHLSTSKMEGLLLKLYLGESVAGLSGLPNQNRIVTDTNSSEETEPGRLNVQSSKLNETKSSTAEKEISTSKSYSSSGSSIYICVPMLSPIDGDTDEDLNLKLVEQQNSQKDIRNLSPEDVTPFDEMKSKENNETNLTEENIIQEPEKQEQAENQVQNEGSLKEENALQEAQIQEQAENQVQNEGSLKEENTIQEGQIQEQAENQVQNERSLKKEIAFQEAQIQEQRKNYFQNNNSHNSDLVIMNLQKITEMNLAIHRQFEEKHVSNTT